jgi:hypothetical protein
VKIPSFEKARYCTGAEATVCYNEQKMYPMKTYSDPVLYPEDTDEPEIYVSKRVHRPCLSEFLSGKEPYLEFPAY